ASSIIKIVNLPTEKISYTIWVRRTHTIEVGGIRHHERSSVILIQLTLEIHSESVPVIIAASAASKTNKNIFIERNCCFALKPENKVSFCCFKRSQRFYLTDISSCISPDESNYEIIFGMIIPIYLSLRNNHSTINNKFKNE
ncbi:hypothetical protein DSL64_26560, partial [Dyadobacter luteus]